jgi:hypothetical protein
VRSDRLASALVAFGRANTASTRQEVLQALTESELIFPAAERGPREKGVRLAFTQDSQGRPLLPGLTDQQHFSVWLPSGGPYARAPAAVFLQTLLAGPFLLLVLNPGGEASALIDRRALELLASGEMPQAADVGDAFVNKWG